MLFEQIGFGEAAVEPQQFGDEAALVSLQMRPPAPEQPALAPQQTPGLAAFAEDLGPPCFVDRVVDVAEDMKLVLW